MKLRRCRGCSTTRGSSNGSSWSRNWCRTCWSSSSSSCSSSCFLFGDYLGTHFLLCICFTLWWAFAEICVCFWIRFEWNKFRHCGLFFLLFWLNFSHFHLLKS